MKVSIITASYNRKEYLKENIESVLALENDPLDIEIEQIIYDDASSDGTDELMSQYPHIKYIKGLENKGPSFGRNKAIEQSTGDYIFVLDSDDIILQRTIHHFVKAALNNPQTDWFICDFIRVDKELRYKTQDDYYAWQFENTNAMLQSIFTGSTFIQHNVFFKKSLFIKAGGYAVERRMAEDLDLFVRFLINKSIPLTLPITSHLHRVHDSNLSIGVDKEKHLREVFIIHEKYKDQI
ncbi:MAG: glycosyltransferase [Candidatus Dojkabacteria bacterium]